MKGISVIILTHNEEKNLSECLDSVCFADELIILDNGSTDKTADIGIKHQARVVKIEGNDFAKMRDEGKISAKYDWVLYIDADERIKKDLADEIMIATGKVQFTSYKLIRKNYFFGKLWPKSEKMLRLIKKDTLIRWEGKLHETPIVSGKTGCLKGELLHFTHDDLAKMVEKTNKWSEIEAKLRFDLKHPKMCRWRFVRVMISAFWKSYIADEGWRMGTAGIVEAIYQSYSMFITYAKLWEMQK